MKKIILASALGSVLILSGCGGGGDDTAAFVPQEFYTISGKISNLNDMGEPGVLVEGVYSIPGDLLNPTITTDSSGNFSLQVLKNDAVFLRATKDSFATINSAKAPLNVNVSGLDIGMPTGDEAQDVINTAFYVDITPLENVAWLVVDIEDTNGYEVIGERIISSIATADEVYTDCTGADSLANATTGPCSGGRPSPMYIAYFNAPGETNITVGSETQLAPIRMGEITYLEFEISAGQVKYDADCASCHAAGTYDTTTFDGGNDLLGKSSSLIEEISSYSPGKKTAVADLTPQEILDLGVFLDSL